MCCRSLAGAAADCQGCDLAPVPIEDLPSISAMAFQSIGGRSWAIMKYAIPLDLKDCMADLASNILRGCAGYCAGDYRPNGHVSKVPTNSSIIRVAPRQNLSRFR